MYGNQNMSYNDEQWGIIYAFFHPELRPAVGESEESVDFFFDLLTGLASEATGFGKTARKDGGGNRTHSIKSGDRGVQTPATLVYEAHAVTERDKYWRAEIALTTALPIGDKLVVSVTDADGEKIPQAKLLLLGSELTVLNGLAAYDLNTFQTNLERTDVSLVYPSGSTVEGTLKFGFGI